MPSGRASPSRYSPTGGPMFASLQQRLTHSRRWTAHRGIAILASATNQNQIDQATAFRASLRLASLPAYEQDPSAGATKIVPQAFFALRMKAIADDAVRFHTTHFFRVLQAALRSPATAPLSKSDLRLSGAFNRLFAAANAAAQHGNPGPLSQMISGARAAHAMIIHTWLSHTDP